MRTSPTYPLLISLAETGFQLGSLPEEDVIALIADGEITAMKVRGQVLVAYDSVVAFTRRAKKQKLVLQEQGEARP